MDADRTRNPGGPAFGVGGIPLKSESWLEMRRRLGRDMTLALVGFPNSGKTSYLYALKSIPRSGRTSHWRVGGGSAEFASLTGVAGQPQRATGAGHLDFARFCRVVRPVLNIAFLGWALGRARWLTTAEVSGETLQRISEGSADVAGSAAEFLEFLGHSTVILGFASLDGLRASRGVGAAGDADEALLGSLKAIERILESAAQRRSATAHPMVMSLLITKADMLAESPELDQIDLPDDRSTVGSIAAARSGPIAQWLEASGSGGGRVRYRVSQLFCHELARGDLEFNEALAADFLKCHAPKSAKQVAAMQSDRVLSASIRVFMCSPYGTAFSDERGGDTFPRADQMRPVMVHEPLESALEQAWAHRDGDRRRRHAMIAAAAALALVVALPATRWLLGARADAALERARDSRALSSWVEARDSVMALERSPEVALHHAVPLVRWLSPRVMDQHAWRLRQCAQLAWGHGLDEASILADRALSLKPGDPDATELVMDLRAQRVAAYLDGRADSLPRRGMDLDSGGVAVLIAELDRLSMTWRNRAASERTALEARLRELQVALGSGSEASAQVRVGGEDDQGLLRAAIEGSIAALSGSRPGTVGAADSAAVDAPLRVGDLSVARKGCDDIVLAHVARWGEVSRGADPWPAGPAWLEEVRIRRESEAVRRMALDRRRRLDAQVGRIGAAAGDARGNRSAECMELVRDLLWARTHPSRSASEAFDDAGWEATEIVVARDRVLAGLESAQPWPQAALVEVAVAFGGDDAGPLQGLLVVQRMLLAERLRELAGVVEREGEEARWQEVLSAMRDARVATEGAIQALDERFFALRAARASPIDIMSLERHLRGYTTHELNPEARLSVARAVMETVASACCTISVADLGRSIEAVVPLGIERSAAASELLAATQTCFPGQGGINRNTIAEQAGRLDLLLPMSAMHWRKGLRPSIEGVHRWFDSARSGDELGPDALSAASLQAMRGMRSLAGDQQFQSLVNACTKHAELVREWQLLKVPGGRGPGAQGGYWLSRLEWSRSKQVATTLRTCERGALEQAMRGPLKDLVVPAQGGFAWAPLRHRERERLELLEANLGISDARSADALVKLVGLRLPTVAELDMALQRPGTLSEPGRKQLSTVRERYITPESLAEVDQTQDGIVGLNSGVCEWTSERLWGKTHMTSTSDDNIRPYVQGVRPALDLIPGDLRQALAP